MTNQDAPPTRVEQVEVKAIVLDTNAFGRGQLDLSVLRSWARDARAAGIEVWLPEPIIWELAAHLTETIDELGERITSATSTLQVAGIETPPQLEYPRDEALVESLEELILQIEGVEILDSAADQALAGLKDQIFSRPPGRKKKGIRTGAADATWLRTVEAYADGRPYLIVSNDIDIERATDTAYEPAYVVVKSLGEAREFLFQYGVAPHELTYEALRALNRLIREGQIAELFQSRPIPDVSTVAEELGLSDADDRVQYAAVSKIYSLVGARRIRTSANTNTAILEAFLLADIDLQIVPTQQTLSEPITSEVNIPHRVVRASFVFEMVKGEPAKPVLEEDLWTMFTPFLFRDSEDALDDCIHAIWDIPELSDEEIATGSTDWVFDTQLYDSTELRLRYSKSGEAGWIVRASCGDEEVELNCQRDHRTGRWSVESSSASMWAIPPPAWVISSLALRHHLST